jgi:hypothetical protein
VLPNMRLLTIDLTQDLTCDPIAFCPASSVEQSKGKEDQTQRAAGSSRHQVHEGFLTIAQEMGNPSGPVTQAVGAALRSNDGYSELEYLASPMHAERAYSHTGLVLTGHSLGAGVATVSFLFGRRGSNTSATFADRAPTASSPRELFDGNDGSARI